LPQGYLEPFEGASPVIILVRLFDPFLGPERIFPSEEMDGANALPIEAFPFQPVLFHLDEGVSPERGPSGKEVC